jgi:hypothetical protein
VVSRSVSDDQEPLVDVLLMIYDHVIRQRALQALAERASTVEREQDRPAG